LFIIPGFEPVIMELLEYGAVNPVTRSVFAISRNIIPFWIAAAFLVAVTLLILTTLSSSPAGRRFKESVFLKLPVAGSLYHSSILSKMAEAMAMTVAAGCDMPAALRYSSGASGCEKLVLESNVVAAQIEQGANIMEAGQFCRMIPKLFLYSVQLGSQRNELQDNLYSLGQMYAEQARCSQARLQAFLCPLILVVVGTFIFLAVLAMFLPMLQIVSGLSGAV
jgi:type IV pilus assembly protein PilC